jgi:flagellar motility protein MotE (MotC chaperone)
MELFADLSKRRKDLEAKEKEIVMREALLKAAQAELEQKTEELTKIKTDIEGLLKQQTDQENQRITSLVKIYEGMKAKDAARIFDSLEMDVLLQVMTRMSERKSAPILAAMDADRARNLTILLAEQSKLPEIPALPTP